MFRKYAYGWITLGFFLGSLFLHWYFGWRSFVDDDRDRTRRQTIVHREHRLEQHGGEGVIARCQRGGEVPVLRRDRQNSRRGVVHAVLEPRRRNDAFL